MNERSVRVRGWCRADLGGGTLDIWPLGLLHPEGMTVNLAISLPVTAQVERLDHGYRVMQGNEVIEAETAAGLADHPDGVLVGRVAEALGVPPLAVELGSGSPRGGGLGASSALMVTLVRALEVLFDLDELSPRQKVALNRDIEARMMGLPTGIQDAYPALLGGALAIHMGVGGERVEHLAVDLEELGASFLVVHSGKSHFSAPSNWEVVRRRLEGDPSTVAHFEGIAAAAARVRETLLAGDLPATGRAMSVEWSHRRKLADGVSTATIESVVDAALGAGAWGAKVCGAGGGGAVVCLFPPDLKSKVGVAVRRAGGQILDALPTSRSLEVEG